MHYRHIVFTFLGILGSLTMAFGADKYEFDKAHTYIGFTAKHFVITNVKGNFTDFSGTILYDPQDITRSSVTAVIKTASINTNNEKRDADLRSGRFLEVEKYPEIIFKSKKIEKQNSHYLVTGDLTIKDVTKTVSFPFTLAGPVKDPMGNNRIGIEAGPLTINRQDYHVSFNDKLDGGGLVVSDEIVINLSVEGVHAKEEKK
ncbi:MAG TPA: YceI family protein [Candidatus Limnocylindrales bacterium]|nr:YceI family protein [Candidatus Limnocylindrales bacterium]